MGLGDWLKNIVSRPQAEVTVVLPDQSPATIEDVIARMRLIEAQLPPKDGVAQFNRLYLAVTEEVLGTSAGHGFEDPEFVKQAGASSKSCWTSFAAPA